MTWLWLRLAEAETENSHYISDSLSILSSANILHSGASDKHYCGVVKTLTMLNVTG